METYIKELVTNIELTNFENTSLKKELKEQKSMTLKLDAENKFLKEKLVSLETSVHDLENQMIEQKSITQSEIQGSNLIKICPEISNCLGVYNLTFDTSEQELKEEFSRFGPLENVLLVRHPLTKLSQGHAFVYYESIEDAKTAKEAMNNQEFNERRIRVDFSYKKIPERSSCLGVFGLSLDTTERELKEVFSKFGPLEKVHLVLDTLTGRSRQYAFIYYESVEDAKTAKEAMHYQKFNGRHIRVDFSITKMPHTRTPGVYMGKPTTVGLTSD